MVHELTLLIAEKARRIKVIGTILVQSVLVGKDIRVLERQDRHEYDHHYKKRKKEKREAVK
jgi:hypothetical protein